MFKRLVLVLVLLAACAYYPDDGGRTPREDLPHPHPGLPVVTEGVEIIRPVITPAPGQARPTPAPTEYRGKPVISWCLSTNCGPGQKPARETPLQYPSKRF